MQNSKYPSTKSCLKELLKNEGLSGLYKGASTIIVTSPIRSSFSISFYTFLKHKFSSYDHFAKGFLAGCITGTVLSIVACPVELVKCEMQVPNSYKSTGDCAKKIFLKSGFPALYKGFMCTALRDFFGFGVFFGVYEEIKGLIHYYNLKFTWWGWLLCGSLSGACCWVAVLPIDCVKTRFQLAHKPVSYYDTLRTIVKTTGVKGLWTGITSCIIRSLIANGIGFSCYECVKEHLPKAMPV